MQRRFHEGPSHSTPYGKRGTANGENRLTYRNNSEIVQQHELSPHGRATNEYALLYAGKHDRNIVQDFRPAAAETIPFPPFLVYCNVIDHLALQRTLRYFEPEHSRLTEGFMTDEATAYIEAMKNEVRSVKNKKAPVGVIFVSPPGQIYLPRPLVLFLSGGQVTDMSMSIFV